MTMEFLPQSDWRSQSLLRSEREEKEERETSYSHMAGESSLQVHLLQNENTHQRCSSREAKPRSVKDLVSSGPPQLFWASSKSMAVDGFLVRSLVGLPRVIFTLCSKELFRAGGTWEFQERACIFVGKRFLKKPKFLPSPFGLWG